MVLDHPVGEGLRHHGPLVFEVRSGGDAGAVGIGGGGHDAVHHGGGEGDVFGHVGPEVRVAQACEARHHLGHGAAIGGEIVAAQNGEGRQTAGLARADGLDEEAGGGAWTVRVAQVVENVRVLIIQLTRCRIMAIALLGDGEGDDLDGRQAHRFDERLGVLRRDEHAAQGPDHPAALTLLV